MEDSLKHLKVDARRRRFDKSHYGSAGATLRKACPYFQRDIQDVDLDIRRPQNDEFLLMSTEVDEAYGIAVSRPHGLSRLDLLDFFEHLMEDYASHESVENGLRITVFRVPAVGWEPGLDTARRQKAHFDRLALGVGAVWEEPFSVQGSSDRLVRYVQTKACKIVGRVSDAPLDFIGDASLLDKNCLTSCSASAKGTRPQSAHINNNDASSCWSPPLADFQAHYLQVDLRADCQVTYISTQGRFPPLLQRPYDPICKFTGAQIMDETHEDMHQWVWKYSVSVRANGGRTWLSLGIFDGNRDMTTEVAHKLLAPVTCRYVRFHVLGFDRRPAMRVGVYGERPGGSTQIKTVEEQTVEYKFTRLPQGVQLSRVPDGATFARESYHARDGWLRGGDGRKNVRHRQRLDACKLLPEARAITRETFDDASEHDDSDDIDTDAGGSYCGCGRLSTSDLRPEASDSSDDESWIVL